MSNQIEARLKKARIFRARINKHLYAIEAFYSDVHEVLKGLRVSIDVRRSWFAPENKSRKKVDAIVCHILPM